MQAEAMNEASATNTDAAIAIVNRVRSRSNAADIALGSMTQAQLRQQIRHHERPVELAMEYTIRTFDLYRWANGTAAPEPISTVMAAHSKPFADNFVDGKHDVFPIPLEEMNKNESLNQNDGY
ncbi:MAG: RagB/SusD family nutrient uptake outer membrane protein, partial [Reichenbachiella sp.]